MGFNIFLVEKWMRVTLLFIQVLTLRIFCSIMEQEKRNKNIKIKELIKITDINELTAIKRKIDGINAASLEVFCH